MKAAILPLFCSCVLGWSPLAQAARPAVGGNPVEANRYARRQVPQSEQSVLAERADQPARQGLESITRPWEVPDSGARRRSPRQDEQDKASTASAARQRVPASNSAVGSAAGSSASRHHTPALLSQPTGGSVHLHVEQSHFAVGQPAHKPDSRYENSLRQHSPAPASQLVSPAVSARPLPRKPRGLVGQATEYTQRDGFTFTVRGTAAYEAAVPETGVAKRTRRPQTSTTTAAGSTATTGASFRATGNQPKPIPASPPSSRRIQPARNQSPKSGHAPRPRTTSAHSRRTAPGRWFRANPLRDVEASEPRAAFANRTPSRDAYIQQTAAAEQTSFAQPGASKAEPIPSLSDESLELPFDLNDNGAKQKPAAEPTEEPAPTAAPKAELSLDDFPFDDQGTEKKPLPTEKPALPDSPFPAADKPMSKPAEKSPATNDDFPFAIPGETTPAKQSEQPTGDTPVEKMPDPALESPTESSSESSSSSAATKQPTSKAPEENASMEAAPFSAPAPEYAPPGKAELKPITAISISIQPPAGDLPTNHAEGITEENSIYYGFGQASRGWAVSSYQWEATAMCYQPLYFEEVNLERYGYSRGVLQPAVSYGQFLINVISMPYKVIAQPSREAVYSLGYHRPGSYTPYRVQYPPRSAAGGMFEAGVILGLVFVIP